MTVMRQLTTGSAALAIIGLSLHAHAQVPYPSKPIRMIVPLAAGGLAALAAMVAAGLFEHNFGDSEFLMLLLVLITLPCAAARERNV